jgi:hypothetical protein
MESTTASKQPDLMVQLRSLFARYGYLAVMEMMHQYFSEPASYAPLGEKEETMREYAAITEEMITRVRGMVTGG